ncbi:MAG: L-glyceraldehyde 3-phosphate reductase [Lentimicrobiaceae bacterium]|nr:L-glyceraldehyde 3-phosphate reductase [Lentimicrobiaceae bacterium]MCB9023619.1 L-glyceraldehyde 3-phosphate reductase [Lentimicrobiaceae bacterium]MCO5264346.1 L-glyceraldehyde 3-phosphate reductase [Lentimicrobium sp.]
MTGSAAENRYATMQYNRCGNSGLKLPAISLGLWHNFGGVDIFQISRSMLLHAFDKGITHFDLANNYGPPPGSAEETLRQVLHTDLGRYRDELVISTKAGYNMWPGPYGEMGSRKHLIASCDQSLRRLGLDYVDIFYSHRPDPETPLDETMGALEQIVRQGKALYVGLSNYSALQTRQAVEILKSMGVRCLIHQPRYSMLDRWVEDGLLDVLEDEGMGCIPYSPLAQGLLTDRYLNGIPENSRAAKEHGFLQTSQITPEKISKIKKLNELALTRGQKLAQMALAWLLKDNRITSVLVGASSIPQIDDSLAALKNISFTADELKQIEDILTA